MQFKTGNCRFAFLSPPPFFFGGGGLGTTFDDHPRLIGKRVVDFLVLIELLSLDVTAAALRTIVGSKWAISLQRGPVDPKFSGRRGCPHAPPAIFLVTKLW